MAFIFLLMSVLHHPDVSFFAYTALSPPTTLLSPSQTNVRKTHHLVIRYRGFYIALNVVDVRYRSAAVTLIEMENQSTDSIASHRICRRAAH